MNRVWLIVVLGACSGKHKGTLEGTSYELDLPSGFSLERELSDRITWKNSDGLEVEIYTTHMWSDGKPAPCDPPSDSVGGASSTINGVEGEDAIFIHRCIDGHHFTCTAMRGPNEHLQPGDHDAGVKICKTLALHQ